MDNNLEVECSNLAVGRANFTFHSFLKNVLDQIPGELKTVFLAVVPREYLLSKQLDR